MSSWTRIKDWLVTSDPEPRPELDAERLRLACQNAQAVLLNGVAGETYEERIPIAEGILDAALALSLSPAPEQEKPNG